MINTVHLRKTLTLAMLISSPWSLAQAADYNALVSANATGANAYKTIAEAIASAPADSSPFVIYLKNGGSSLSRPLTIPSCFNWNDS
ncbi:hypothetical protein V6M93_20320 [Pectobacterium brasiliense]|uniref:hypothetical protein n=1 Tax=Pectobacterium brasiliense TaxID=180957 RepID=UPI003670AD78